MAVSTIDEELREEIAAVAESADCQLLHVRFRGNLLQVFLDRPDGGVTIDHCQTVSKQLSALLDVHDFGPKKYLLEVGSPGLDRELFSSDDWHRFTGRLVRVTFRDENDKKKTVVGRLQGFDRETGGGAATVVREEVSEDRPDHRFRIPLDRVQIARLEIEL